MNALHPLLWTPLFIASLAFAQQHAAPSPSSNHASTPAHGSSKPSGSAAGGSHGSSGGGAHGGHQAPGPADFKNIDIQHYLGWIWVSFVSSFLLYQAILHGVRYMRTIACLDNNTQRYFAIPHIHYARFKKHLLDAPLFRTRHHREMKLSTAINIGTLPSRLQMLMLLGYFGTNVAFCVMSIDFSGTYSKVAGELRNRCGILAVMNMLPLFILAGRNNPLIQVCGVSFDTFNLVHRWIGRIVVLEGVAHMGAWLANKVHTLGWEAVVKAFATSQFIQTGLIATCAFTFLLLHSPSALRHAFYESFLHLHILAVSLAIAGLWFHLKELPQRKILYAVLSIWVWERLLRLIWLTYRNISTNGNTMAEVESLPGDCVRVTVRMARPWRFRAGQHAYLYLPSIGLWTSHPFSVAWSEEEEPLPSTLSPSPSPPSGDPEKGALASSSSILPMSRQDISALTSKNAKTAVSFLIRRRTGFTEKLFTKASLSATGKFSARCFLEGPYGGENLSSYGTVMLWAAGIGITHQIPHIRDIVSKFSEGSTATRRLTLIWIIQSPEHLEWIRPWMTSILSLPRRREVLKILLFVTRPRSTKEIHSPSSSVQMYPGKPNVQALVDQEMGESVGAACVSVCGTGGLADDVRRAVRNRQEGWNVDFREESFSW